MTRIAVLGSTGSIGVQTLDVAARHPTRLQIVALVAHRNADRLRAQAAETGATRLALVDEEAARRAGLPGGMPAVLDLVQGEGVDLVVVAVAGVVGLEPTIAAIRARKRIALASKEVLVAAGEVVMPLLREVGVSLTPIDSEHSALFQCLEGRPPESVERLVLTASGGPFRGCARERLASVTSAEALDHPTWRMGGKITVDSATLMNKGLEVIEARWLFDVPLERIDVVVHPQSIVHSLVELTDGSVIAQLGWPDMRLPIQLALLYPERPPSGLPRWSPIDTPTLTFERPDTETFRCLEVARESLRRGGTYPCALNAANEEAATAFLRGECGFLRIAEIVEDVVQAHEPAAVSLEALVETDRWARDRARMALRSE